MGVSVYRLLAAAQAVGLGRILSGGRIRSAGLILIAVGIARPVFAQQPSPEIISSCLLLAGGQLPPGIAGISLRSAAVTHINTRPDNVSFFNVRIVLDFAGQQVTMDRRCGVTADGVIQLVR